MESINTITRSKVHDFVRGLEITAELRTKLINYLDGKIDAYGMPNTGRTPHDNVERARNVSSVNADARQLWLEVLHDSRFDEQFLAYCRFISDKTNWEPVSKLYQEPIKPITPAPKTYQKLSKKEMQNILKANDIKYGGRTKEAKLKQMLIDNDLMPEL